MAKTGRPKKGESEGGTTQVRCFDDMAEKLSDLTLVLPLSTAQILQRVAGANLNELHETHAARIEQVKAKRRAAEEAERQAKEESVKLLSEEPKPRRKPKAES